MITRYKVLTEFQDARGDTLTPGTIGSVHEDNAVSQTWFFFTIEGTSKTCVVARYDLDTFCEMLYGTVQGEADACELPRSQLNVSPAIKKWLLTLPPKGSY